MTNQEVERVEEVAKKFMADYEAELAKYQPERDILLEQKDLIGNRLKEMERDAMKQITELAKYVAKAQQAHTLNRFKKALEQSRKGEPLDLSEEEFELFSAIQNDGVTKNNQKIEELFKEIENNLEEYFTANDEGRIAVTKAWSILKKEG